MRLLRRWHLLALSSASIFACSSDQQPTKPAPKPGNLELQALTSGASKDLLYLVFVDDQPAQILLSAGSLRVNSLSPAQHTLRIAGIAPNCSLNGGTSRSVAIPDGATLTDTLQFTCAAVTDRVMYGSNTDGNYDLYYSNADGSNFTRVTTDTAYHGRWSPDGSHIVFMSPKSGLDQIYVTDSLGAHEVQLTTEGVNHDFPQWSPDGAHIAYTRESAVWIMNADGSSPHAIGQLGAFGPASWSPDGNRITVGTGSQVLVMNADGTNAAVLTNDTSAYSTEPAWSPDGSKIAFITDRDSAFTNIYVMNADGSNQIPLTFQGPGVLDEQIAWSPDGTRIAFRTNRDGGHPDIYVMNADGSDQTKLSHNIWDNYGPSWHP